MALGFGSLSWGKVAGRAGGMVDEKMSTFLFFKELAACSLQLSTSWTKLLPAGGYGLDVAARQAAVLDLSRFC